jgi:hypothetical protein
MAIMRVLFEGELLSIIIGAKAHLKWYFMGSLEQDKTFKRSL